jgi:hypothetical protein
MDNHSSQDLGTYQCHQSRVDAQSNKCEQVDGAKCRNQDLVVISPTSDHLKAKFYSISYIGVHFCLMECFL